MKIRCKLLCRKIEEGVCYDIQMVRGGFIKETVLDKPLDRECANSLCPHCKYNQLPDTDRASALFSILTGSHFAEQLEAKLTEDIQSCDDAVEETIATVASDYALLLKAEMGGYSPSAVELTEDSRALIVDGKSIELTAQTADEREKLMEIEALLADLSLDDPQETENCTRAIEQAILVLLNDRDVG